MKFLNKMLFAGLLAFAASESCADALSAKPLRVGPVQNYGALGTSGGQVISLSTKKPVMLRGVSLFWSDAIGQQYYNSNAISWATENLGIDVFRFAMAIGYYDSEGGTSNPVADSYAYLKSPTSYLNIVDKMVEIAIKNDIYIILDWHSHRAEHEQTEAENFFATVSQKYKDIPNVIFEVYNEPVHTAWSTVQSYASAVASKIRANTQNLILVGTPSWSQLGSRGGVSGGNIAYVFHFYAATHSKGSFSGRITNSKAAGDAVFISEWGTTSASGKGSPDPNATKEWLQFMEANGISNCNWSFRQFKSTVDGTTEESAFFDGDKILSSKDALNNATLTASGELVADYLKSHKGNWADTLVAGKNTGTCAFASTKASETDGVVANRLKAGCTYTSSDETVAAAEGSNIVVKSAGFAIFTGNDGSLSVVSITENPSQTVNNFVDFTCRLGGTCTKSHQMKDYTNTGSNEAILSALNKTMEGATVTFKSLNPDIVDIKYTTCMNKTYCYSSLNQLTYFCDFKSLGDAKIVATAPAVTGYRAMNDTITVTFAKALQKVNTKTFKSQTVALGATVTGGLPTTTQSSSAPQPITYTFNGQPTSPYLTQVGEDLVAGNQNAIVEIRATAPGTDYYEDLDQVITIVIGDSSSAVNKEEYQENPIISNATLPFRAEMQNSGLILQLNKAGMVEWGIYTVAGKKMLGNVGNYSAGSHWISMESLPAGSYLMKVRQGTRTASMRWNKQ